ncbi:MAG: hypothetical protein R2912_10780 [Eubacteriales bacterium]
MTCIFVDHGLLRENEAEQVMQVYHDTLSLNIVKVDARERLFISWPASRNRKRNARSSAKSLSACLKKSPKARRRGVSAAGHDLSGCDRERNEQRKHDQSHHNVGGLPRRIGFKKGLVEPLRMLFKDGCVRWAEVARHSA